MVQLPRLKKSLLQLENTAKNNIHLFSSSHLFKKYIGTINEDDRYLMQQPLLIKRFSEYQKTYPEYYEISFITPKGDIDTFVSLKKSIKSKDQNGHASFVPAVIEGKEVTIRYAKDDNTNHIALYLYKSLYTIDRSIDPDTIDRISNPAIWISKHRGFLSISISIENIVSEIRQSAAENNVAMILLNDQKDIITSTFPQISEDKLPETFIKAWDKITPVSFADNSDYLNMGKKTLQGLSLYALIPSDAIDKQIYQLESQIFFITLGSIILTLVLVFYVLNGGLVKPVNKLIATSQEIGRGNLHPIIGVKGSNEMGLLSDAIMNMSEKLALSQKEIHHIAYHDQLTGLPNRRMMKQQINKALMYAKHHQTIGALFFLDIDNFKNINDSLGHEVGDELLQAFSHCLKTVLRGEDSIFDEMVCRFGGDEFVILLENLNNSNDAGRVAQRILDVLQTPLTASVGEQFVSTSIGIAVFPDDSQDSDELMRKADNAMYHAKENGKNNSQFFSTEMNEKLQRRNKIESYLRHAITNQELNLKYRVQVDIKTNHIAGVEVLLGWQSKLLGEVSADEFIAIAEETNQINAIGNWVLEQGIAQAKKWHDSEICSLKVAINISAKQFKYMDIENYIIRYLKEYDLPSNLLEIELTESTLVSNLDQCFKNLEQINARGVDISLDHFGSGYSSLSHLQKFPLTQIKIDSSFIANICLDKDSKSIVSAIIALGHSLNLLVLAEGVETEEQREILTVLGCDRIQGNLCSPPLDQTELLAFVSKHNN